MYSFYNRCRFSARYSLSLFNPFFNSLIFYQLLSKNTNKSASSFTGSVFVPVHYASRIAFIHIMLFSVLILNYYSASIVSDRLKNVGVKMNDSLISLADSYLKVAAEPTPYIRSFLQVHTFTFMCIGMQMMKLIFF